MAFLDWEVFFGGSFCNQSDLTLYLLRRACIQILSLLDKTIQVSFERRASLKNLAFLKPRPPFSLERQRKSQDL